jgi:hypothetical protein
MRAQRSRLAPDRIGKWSVRNGVLRMIADKIDGKPDHYDNSYTIEGIAPNEFRARLPE